MIYDTHPNRPTNEQVFNMPFFPTSTGPAFIPSDFDRSDRDRVDNRSGRRASRNDSRTQDSWDELRSSAAAFDFERCRPDRRPSTKPEYLAARQRLDRARVARSEDNDYADDRRESRARALRVNTYGFDYKYPDESPRRARFTSDRRDSTVRSRLRSPPATRRTSTISPPSSPIRRRGRSPPATRRTSTISPPSSPVRRRGRSPDREPRTQTKWSKRPCIGPASFMEDRKRAGRSPSPPRGRRASVSRARSPSPTRRPQPKRPRKMPCIGPASFMASRDQSPSPSRGRRASVSRTRSPSPTRRPQPKRPRNMPCLGPASFMASRDRSPSPPRRRSSTVDGARSRSPVRRGGGNLAEDADRMRRDARRDRLRRDS